MTEVNARGFRQVFTPSKKEFWLQWKSDDWLEPYELLHHLQNYLRDPMKVYTALVTLNKADDVIAELTRSEIANGFAAAETIEHGTDTDKFLDRIMGKVPLIDKAADDNTEAEAVKHGRLTHRIQWYIIAHHLKDDTQGQKLLAAAKCEYLADAYSLSAQKRKKASNGKTIAPWTAMVDRPVVKNADRLLLPDATIPENLGALLFAGNFKKILDAEDGLWGQHAYLACLIDHPFVGKPEVAARMREQMMREMEREKTLKQQGSLPASGRGRARGTPSAVGALLGPPGLGGARGGALGPPQGESFGLGRGRGGLPLGGVPQGTGLERGRGTSPKDEIK